MCLMHMNRQWKVGLKSGQIQPSVWSYIRGHRTLSGAQNPTVCACAMLGIVYWKKQVSVELWVSDPLCLGTAPLLSDPFPISIRFLPALPVFPYSSIFGTTL